MSHYRRYNKPNNKLKRKILHMIKSQPCADCGGTFDPECMDFDHVKGKKITNVGTMAYQNYSMRAILEEVSKCDVICANCHRLRTKERRK